MNTKRQIFIDKRIIKPLMMGMNLFVRLLGKILRIDHSLDKNFKTIAICKYKGMGSIIQSTPLIQALKQKYPGAKIIYITTKANVSLLSEINYIDKIIYLDDSSFWKLLLSFPSFIYSLITARIELYFDLEIYSNTSSLITILSMAKNRFGFYLRSSEYRMGIYTHMMYYNTRSSVSQTYMQFARLLGCNDVNTELFRLKSERKEIKYDGGLFKLENEKYIVINPNASDLRIERRWSHANFVSLIVYLTETYKEYTIVLIGSKQEQTYTNSILDKLASTKNVLSLAGKTSISELIAVIQHCALLITNDTGPMHIAFSVRAKVVALFGPCAPSQYGNENNCHIIYKNVYCSPCVHEFEKPPCNGNNQCMKMITIEDVKKGVEKTLAIAGLREAVALNKIHYSDSNNEVLGVVIR